MEILSQNKRSLARNITVVVLVYWLSLLHNFIQWNLNSGFAHVQILLAACWRFMMVKISDISDLRLQIRLIVFRSSTIPQKQFIIIIRRKVVRRQINVWFRSRNGNKWFSQSFSSVLQIQSLVIDVNMVSIFPIKWKLKYYSRNSIFKHFWSRPILGHKCMPWNLTLLIVTLLCHYYKSFSRYQMTLLYFWLMLPSISKITPGVWNSTFRLLST